MKCDLHLHSHYSIDAEPSLIDYCEQALQLGLDCLCFTDHLDYDPADAGRGFYRAEAYFAELAAVQEAYAGRLLLLSGLEFSEPHRYPAQLAALSAYPYDFILGSVHYWDGGLFAGEIRAAGIDAATNAARYWQGVLDAVQAGGFDSLAHLDFPRRYLADWLYPQEMLRQIFRTMVAQGIALEINTSSLRKGLSETLPGPALLRLYREQGGEFVTCGSDAHFVGDLAADLPLARDLAAAAGLCQVYFRARQRCLVD